jgi:hypothetical protein
MGRKPLHRAKKYRKDEEGKVTVSGTLKELPLDCCYDKIPGLKRANIIVEFTEEQVLEMSKCAVDIEYFARNYVFVIHPDKGRVLCELRPYQLRMIKAFAENRYSVAKSGRQSGKSMSAAVFILHSLIFSKDKKSAILANKLATAKEILEKIKLAYRLLPYWLQIGVDEWHKTSMQLENGCHCFASATSADAIVGLTVNGILYIDEYAKIRRSIIDAFLDTVFPTISASVESKIIVTSTSRGMNHFYELWQKAIKKRSEFFPVEVKWNEVPGRDEKFRQSVIKNKGEQHFNQEYACAFLGSSSTLVKGSIIEMMDIQDAVEILKEGKFRIYAKPIIDRKVDDVLIKGRTYVVGVDSAKGTGNDYSVANVFDITTYPFRQVAIYRVNDKTTRNFAEYVVEIAKMFNNAYIMIENNDIGQAVVDYIWNDAEYENLVNYNTKNRIDIGIRSTPRTKSLANDIVKQLMEDFKLEICDSDTIYELSRYVELKPGKFGAEEGENDDCVTSMIWAIFIIKTNYLEDDDIKDEVKEIVKELKDEGEIETLDDAPLDMRVT